MKVFTLANHCNPKCIFFPNQFYEKSCKDYYIDDFGVKHSNTKVYCGFDDHLITDWKNCNNYCEEFNKTNIQNLNSKDKTIILLGKSAAGKDYILNYLIEEYGFNPIISHTTRPIRKNEVNGKDYYFIDSKEFSQMLFNEEFVEAREYATLFENKPDIWYYGITKEEFDNKTKKICVVDTTGQQEIIKYCGKENIVSIYIDVEDEIREKRAKIRGSFSQPEWDRRLKDDNKKFKKIKYNYMLKNNGTKEELHKNIKNILRKENLIG